MCLIGVNADNCRGRGSPGQREFLQGSSLWRANLSFQGVFAMIS